MQKSAATNEALKNMREESRISPFLTVVCPVHNEEASVAAFCEKAKTTLDAAGISWEILFVDDGSTDDTIRRIYEVCADWPSVRVVKLSRNFGKEAALTAGYDLSVGQVVCSIDVDLQDPIETVVDMIARWREGYDVVLGRRVSRDSDTMLKRSTAESFYWLYNKVSKQKLVPNISDFCLLDRRVVAEVSRLREANRFMKGLVTWPGFRTTTVEYARQARKQGKSSFNYWKLWNFALDGFTAFSTVPLRLWTYVGGIVGLVGVAYAIYITAATLIMGIDVPGYASLIVSILLLGGMQLISIGVLGEYVGRMFLETKGRPVYVVDQVHDIGADMPAAAERETW